MQIILGLVIAVALIGGLFHFYMQNYGEGGGNPASRTQIKVAVMTGAKQAQVQCGVLTGESPVASPEEIARDLVKTMNEAQEKALDGDEKLVMQKKLFVSNRATEPWQVAVGGDNAEGYVWLDGYGAELDEPFTWEEIDCL